MAPPDDPSHPPPTVTDNGYSYGSFPRLHRSSHDAEAPSEHETPSVIVARSDASAPAKPLRVLAPDLVRGLLMPIMALDHCAVISGIWAHGTSSHNESDSLPVERWNQPTGYVVRTLTHMCMAGFTFLLGMGVVYLGRSRSRPAVGWGAGRLAWYFFVRMVVLTGVSVLFGLLSSGFRVWFMNIALFSLGVNYFIAGMLWLLVERTEGLLASGIAKILPEEREEDDAEPLLGPSTQSSKTASARASSLSWHVHNVFLLGLSFVTIFWNIWLSPTHGHCAADTSSLVASVAPEDMSRHIPLGEFLRNVWFYDVAGTNVLSVSPPLAWLSFAILGLLYGRIMTRQRWALHAQTIGHVAASLLFFLLFVSTRLLRWGNLSENCLRTPAHVAHPEGNPYLVDGASFFYIVKYPPDVAYYGFTMSGVLLLLGAFTEVPPLFATRWFTVLLDFGTAALFFYIGHLVLASLLGSLVVSWFGTPFEGDKPFPMGPDGYITQMWVYWLYWLVLVLIMWPLCKWYSRFKSTKGPDSLWRFF